MPPMNGDHAEYELENANTPPRERSDWPLPSFDARDWAEAFCDKQLGDTSQERVDIMIGWFSNALMRGYDEATERQRAFYERQHKRELERMRHRVDISYVGLYVLGLGFVVGMIQVGKWLFAGLTMLHG